MSARVRIGLRCGLALAAALLGGCGVFVRDRGDRAQSERTAAPAPAPAAVKAPEPPPPSVPAPVAPPTFEARREAARNSLARTDRWSMPGEQAGYYVDVLHARLLTLAAQGISVSRSDTEIQVRLVDGAWFASGSARLEPDAVHRLAPLVKVLGEFDKTLVCIVGHTDEAGPEDVNLRLSQQRAQAVARELAAGGVAARRLVVAGFGETAPVAGGADEHNRRVEFILTPVVR